MTDQTTTDKNGRPLRVGDVLKVFHFTGARRKRHYMYKQIVGTRWLGKGLAFDKPKTEYFDVSHLNLSSKENYTIGKNDGLKADYEIIQRLDDIHDRPTLAAAPEAK